MIKLPKKSIVFFGTHNFAAAILEGLLKSPFISVDLVVTQPDKPAGRKKEIQKSPVKILAEKHKIKLVQPEKLKNFNDLVPSPYNLVPTLGIVAQYGLLIPEKIINAPKFGTLNVHTSLLPKYRGASPIQSAIINGETETGVTIMKMDKGLDTGPIILQAKININPRDNYLSLDEKLAKLGLATLLTAIPDYLEGKILPQPQNDALATACRQLTREDGRIDWHKTSKDIFNLFRGFHSWPGIWTTWNNNRLKLLQIEPDEQKIETGLVKIKDNKIYVGSADASLKILKLQLEGKKTMDAKTFLNGYKNIDNSRLN